jgi:hypothetical protein
MLNDGFYKKVEDPKYLKNILYGDTDSLFLCIPTKTSAKQMSIDEIIKISKDTGKNINDLIQQYMVKYLFPKANIDPNFNKTQFKNEMIMSSIMFLDVKKQYAYKLLVKEGVVLTEPETKYTGIQIVRTNTAKITSKLLREMIEDVILNPQITRKQRIPKLIELVDAKHKVFNDFADACDFTEIGIPCKWQKQDQHIMGMKLYNFIMEKETFNLGSSGRFIYCKFHDTRTLNLSGIDTDKLNGIVVPYSYDKDKLRDAMAKYKIIIDRQTQWDTLYSKTCQRLTELVKLIDKRSEGK